MLLDDKSPEQIARMEEDLLAKIPDEGTIGNQTLREASHLKDDVYLAVRNRLRDAGRLSIGRGRGGSIRKTLSLPHGAADGPASEKPIRGTSKAHRENEATLYQPMQEVLKRRWTQDQSFSFSMFENTSRGGRRQDGTWARPDLTCIAVTTYPYLPGKYLDVVTFEVKPSWSIDVTAVYEALSHRRRATRSYVLLHVPHDELDEKGEVLAEMCEAASKLGIGVIVAEDPANYDTWDIREEADRVEPDPAKLNEFIETQLPESTHELVRAWLK